jgi:hypothetical protein
VRRLTLALVCLVQVGCAGTAHHAAEAKVRGTIVTAGGPAPGAPRPVPGASFRLVPVNAAGSAIPGHTDAHGRFAVAAPPGTYRVVMLAHTPMSDGTPIQPVHRMVRAVGGRTTIVRLAISIR